MDFLRVKFKGPEFDTHKLTLGVLPDLDVIIEMILETSKMMYKAESGKKRTPNHLFRSLNFHLERVEPGSAIPVVEMSGVDFTEYPELLEALEAGKKRVLQCVKQAKAGDFDKSLLPRSAFKKYARLGKGLSGSASLELPDPDNQSQFISLDSSTRSKLASVSETLEKVVFFKGRLFRVDTKSSIVSLETEAGTVSAEFSVRLKEKVRAGLDRIVIGAGMARVTTDGTTLCIEGIEHLSILSEDEERIEDLCRRIEDLKGLPSGWYGSGLGSVIDPVLLNQVEEILTEWALEYSIPVPLIFPCVEECSLRLEWQIGLLAIDVSWNLATGDAFAVGLDGLEDVDLNLNQPEDKGRVLDALRNAAGVFLDDRN